MGRVYAGFGRWALGYGHRWLWAKARPACSPKPNAQGLRVAGAAFGALLLTTPEHYNRTTKREDVLASLERAKDVAGFDANDKIRQTQAMIAHDVSRAFGGSLSKAAAAVKARVLVIVGMADHVVTPGPAIEFAELLGAPVVELESDCGHLATSCEAERINRAVAEFLER